MSYFPSLPDVTLVEVFQNWPELANAFHGYAQQVMRGPSPLTEGERELIAAFVSRLNGCDYCTLSHSKTAERFDIEAGVVEQLARDINGASVDERLKPLLQFVEKLTRSPGHIGHDDVRQVLQAGWDETALYHAIHVCGAFNLINRVVEAVGIEADEATAEMAARMLSEKGYAAVGDMLRQ